MIQATAAFKQSNAADSNYARAWSGLADAYVLSMDPLMVDPSMVRTVARGQSAGDPV